MSSRRWKRQWLAATGALQAANSPERGGGSSGAPEEPKQRPLTRALVLATLDKIANDDPLWVAVACIDAIRRQLTPLPSDPILLRHVLAVGLAATSKSTQTSLDLLSSPSHAEAMLRTLGARKTLLQYTRMLDVWNKVYGPEADRFASKWDPAGDGTTPSTADDDDDDDDFDAWAELAETTPSPIAPQSLRTSALGFVLSSPSQQAMQLALAGQPLQLASFLRALPDALSSEILPQRLELIRALVLSTFAAGGDVSPIADAQLLPRIQDGQEVSLWTRLSQPLAGVEHDFTDKQEVRLQIASRGLDAESTAQGGAVDLPPLSPPDLLAFYQDLVVGVERQLASVDRAAQLASLVATQDFGMTLSDTFTRLEEDIGLLARLVYGASSSKEARQWTLAHFREACSAAVTDATSRVRLALLYIESASDQQSDLASARDGAVPLLRVIAQRNALQSGSKTSADQQTHAYFVDLLLALAEQGSVRILGSLLASSGECGVTLDKSEQLRVLIASIVGLPSIDAAQHAMLGDVLLRYLSAESSSVLNHTVRPLHELVGPTLAAASSSSRSTIASVHSLLANSSTSALLAYLARCFACQQASMRLRRFSDSVTVAWLISLEGSREAQQDGIMRLVRSYARSPGQVQQYTQLADALRSHVEPRQAFDQLQVHDVARLVLEGAARASNMQVFDQVFSSETTNHLTAAEQEAIVLDAAEELYDNASSANVHQGGDMKTAYDLLSRLPKPESESVKRFKAFIEATSRLCSFRIPSELHTGTLLSPIEIRLSMDRLSLVRRLLSSRDDAYRTPDMISDIALKLSAVPPGVRQQPIRDSTESGIPHRTLVENNVLAMLTEAALAQADYAHAQTSCEKLVTNASALGKRVEQVRHLGQDETHASTLRLYDEVANLAHRTCHQLSKQPDWDDYASRLRWAGYALAFCPPEQLARYLTTWRHAAQQLEDEMQANPPKALVDELQLAGLSRNAGSLGGLGGGLGAALQAGTGGLSAAGLAALSQFGGSLESYANPLGALFARAPAAIRPLAAAGVDGPEARSGMPDLSRNESGRSAARLFDGLGGSDGGRGGDAEAVRTPSEGQPGYMDPAERAARAARRFFGGFGSGF